MAVTTTSPQGWPGSSPRTPTTRRTHARWQPRMRLRASRRCSGVIGGAVARRGGEPARWRWPGRWRWPAPGRRPRTRRARQRPAGYRGFGGRRALVHRYGFAGERRLVHQQGRGVDQFPSAAIRSPSASTNRSPGTTSAAGTSISVASRTTGARGALRWCKAVIADQPDLLYDADRDVHHDQGDGHDGVREMPDHHGQGGTADQHDQQDGAELVPDAVRSGGRAAFWLAPIVVPV